MEPKHLNNAPITEALLDLRVQLPPGTTLSELESLHRRIEHEYPAKQSKKKFHVMLDTQHPATASQEVSDLGFIFWSSDGKRAVQARMDGFSLSHLAPYGTWEELRDEAKRLWGVFCDDAHPTRITRVALRYINRLPLPLPITFEDYLLTFPRMGPSFLTSVTGLLMRVVAPAPDGATVVITEAIDETTVSANSIDVILDIDVFRQVDLPIAEQEESWRVLEALRELKNEAFFGSITDKAGELFA